MQTCMLGGILGLLQSGELTIIVKLRTAMMGHNLEAAYLQAAQVLTFVSVAVPYSSVPQTKVVLMPRALQ